jgi:hypothetical protein
MLKINIIFTLVSEISLRFDLDKSKSFGIETSIGSQTNIIGNE